MNHTSSTDPNNKTNAMDTSSDNNENINVNSDNKGINVDPNTSTDVNSSTDNSKGVDVDPNTSTDVNSSTDNESVNVNSNTIFDMESQFNLPVDDASFLLSDQAHIDEIFTSLPSNESSSQLSTTQSSVSLSTTQSSLALCTNQSSSTMSSTTGEQVSESIQFQDPLNDSNMIISESKSKVSAKTSEDQVENGKQISGNQADIKTDITSDITGQSITEDQADIETQTSDITSDITGQPITEDQSDIKTDITSDITQQADIKTQTSDITSDITQQQTSDITDIQTEIFPLLKKCKDNLNALKVTNTPDKKQFLLSDGTVNVALVKKFVNLVNDMQNENTNHYNVAIKNSNLAMKCLRMNMKNSTSSDPSSGFNGVLERSSGFNGVVEHSSRSGKSKKQKLDSKSTKEIKKRGRPRKVDEDEESINNKKARAGYVPLDFSGCINMPVNTILRRNGYDGGFNVTCFDIKEPKDDENKKSRKFLRSLTACYWLGLYHPKWLERENLVDNPQDRSDLAYEWLQRIKAPKYTSLAATYANEFNGGTFISANKSSVEPNHRSFLDNGEMLPKPRRGKRPADEPKNEMDDLRLRNYLVNPNFIFKKHVPNRNRDFDRLVAKYKLQDIWALTREDIYGNFFPSSGDYVYRGKTIYVTEKYIDKKSAKIRGQVNRYILDVLRSGKEIKRIVLCPEGANEAEGEIVLKEIDVIPVTGIGLRSLSDWDGELSDEEKKTLNKKKRKIVEKHEEEEEQEEEEEEAEIESVDNEMNFKSSKCAPYFGSA